jgi:glycosyltransferase involved in cell wall biosynthesis
MRRKGRNVNSRPGDSRGGTIRAHAFVEGLDIGGAESLLADFAVAAGTEKIDFSVGCLRRYTGVSAERLIQVGIQPTVLDVTDLKLTTVFKVRRHFAANRPDIVHTHLRDATMLGCLAARSLGVPSVTTIHGTRWNDSGKERLRDRLMALSARTCAARVIAVSEAARDAYLAQGWDRPDRVVVIRNGIDDRRAEHGGELVRAEFGIEPDEPVITMISGLRREKCHDVAVAAFATVLEKFPRARLLIAGDGPERDSIARAAAALGDRVILAGYRTDGPELLAVSDVVLLPSSHEALPTTLIEAAAAGLPSVATSTGGIGEIVVDEVTGLLVPAPPSPGPVADALQALLADPERRAAMGRTAREHFLAEFGLDRWVRATRGLYEEILSEAS